MEKPQIAVAVILENGGWGVNAAPLVRRLTDFYLLRLKRGMLSSEVKGSRETANPLLQLNAPLSKQKSSVQAAFEAVAQEHAASAPAASAVRP